MLKYHGKLILSTIVYVKIIFPKLVKCGDIRSPRLEKLVAIVARRNMFFP